MEAIADAVRGAARYERIRLAVAVVVVAAAGVAFVEFPGKLGDVHGRAAADAAKSRTERLLAGARAIDISPEILLAARETIPPDATYGVDTGARTPVSSPLVLSAFPGYAENWLLPRRQVDLSADPQWLVCYGCDPTPWGKLTVVWSQNGLVIARRAQ